VEFWVGTADPHVGLARPEIGACQQELAGALADDGRFRTSRCPTVNSASVRVFFPRSFASACNASTLQTVLPSRLAWTTSCGTERTLSRGGTSTWQASAMRSRRRIGEDLGPREDRSTTLGAGTGYSSFDLGLEIVLDEYAH
jgi:hypothetical protein